MNFEDKNSFPGYIYFRDNGMDYKIGLTNNLVVRGRAYKTENPRDTVIDYFFVETYAEAEAIEAEMKQAARAEGRCSFDNSDEWLQRTADSSAFWDRFFEKHAKWVESLDDPDRCGSIVEKVISDYLSGLPEDVQQRWARWNIWQMPIYEPVLVGKLDELAETEEKLKAAQDYIARLEASLKGHKMNYAKVTNDLKSDIDHLEQEIRSLNGDIDESVSENMIPNCFDFFSSFS